MLASPPRVPAPAATAVERSERPGLRRRTLLAVAALGLVSGAATVVLMQAAGLAALALAGGSAAISFWSAAGGSETLDALADGAEMGWAASGSVVVLLLVALAAAVVSLLLAILPLLALVRPLGFLRAAFATGLTALASAVIAWTLIGAVAQAGFGVLAMLGERVPSGTAVEGLLGSWSAIAAGAVVLAGGACTGAVAAAGAHLLRPARRPIGEAQAPERRPVRGAGR